jgi:hypothetical protein
MTNVISIVNETNPLEGEFSQLQAVLPLQFYGARRGTSEVEPLRRLMVAMLVDAVRCFQTKFERRQPGMRWTQLSQQRSDDLNVQKSCPI